MDEDVFEGLNGFQKAQKLIGIAREHSRTEATDKKLDEVVLASRYGEPGYGNPKSGAIVLGDWQPAVKNDPTMVILAAHLVKEGIDVAQFDEWSRCEDCGRLFRTQPDERDWVRSIQTTDSGQICLECLKASKSAA